MTAPARDGRDKPFSDWLRNHPELHSRIHSMYVTDIDMTFHRYQTNVDAIGTRKVKLMMDVEIKTNCAWPDASQRETLFFKHQLLQRKSQLYSTILSSRVAVWCFGHFVLVLSGDRPDASESIEWCRFVLNGKLNRKRIPLSMLVDILGFRLDPMTLKPIDLRRHHLTKRICVLDESGLFPVERHIIKRS